MNAIPTHTSASTSAREFSQAKISGLPFDWLMILLSLVFVGGLFLDGWAHNHGKVDQTFFTPWHAFFYAGFFLTAAALVGAVLLNWRRGFSLAAAIPDGYRSSVAGVVVFAVGGVGDLVWHTTFSIEDGIEALFSPTHLLLGIGLLLIVTGPLSAGWMTGGRNCRWHIVAPAFLSTCLLTSILTFFMLVSHPVTQMIAGSSQRHFNNDVGVVAGMLGLLVTSGQMIGIVLLLLRRWQLRPGSLTLIWGLNTVAMTIIDYEVPLQLWLGGGMLVGAIFSDLLLLWLHPSVERPGRLRLFATAGPMLLIGGFFAAMISSEGTSWSIHLWSGSIVLAGILGILLSYLVAPPALPKSDGVGFDQTAN